MLGRRIATGLGLVGTLLLAPIVAAGPAGADPVGTGSATASGATVTLGGQGAVPPTPEATVSLPPGGEDAETTVGVPAAPLAVNGTLTADVAVHAASDVASQLTVSAQGVPGPYNARATALIEGLDVLLDTPAAGVSLVSAAAVRAEAVAVCSAGTVSYSANSEVVDLDIGGTDVPLNGPIQDILDAVGDVLEQSGLNAVVDVQRNVVTVTADGASVDALRISVAGGMVADVVIGHAEVSGVACGALPECSDTVDNADAEDTVADAADPGCHTDGNVDNPDSYDPDDDDETDLPECSDTVDNADPEDTVADAADPGCHTDGDAGNPDSYVPLDDDETDAPVVTTTAAPTPTTARQELARTGAPGGPVGLPLALALGAGAVTLVAARRRALS